MEEPHGKRMKLMDGKHTENMNNEKEDMEMDKEERNLIGEGVKRIKNENGKKDKNCSISTNEVNELEKETLNTLDEEEIFKMMKCKKNLVPVLDDRFNDNLPTVKVFVGVVVDKKLISKVMSILTAAIPIPKLQHLKRVRQRDVLICECEEMTMDSLEIKLKQLELFDIFEGQLKVMDVVSVAPLVRKQYEAAHKMWPCNFHVDKYSEKLISGAFFSDTEVEKHRRYMAAAFEVARIQKLQSMNILAEKQSDTSFQFNLNLDESKGALVVDPKTDSIVAIGYDTRINNVYQHSSMIAIDNVAKSQNGGNWNIDLKVKPEDSKDENEIVLLGIPNIFKIGLESKFDGLKFGAVPTVKRNFVECSVDSTNLKRDEPSVNKESKPSGPYLCTNYDIYLTHEPCLLCSMALVHSRAKRVFFAVRNEEFGALDSKTKLHTVTSLNHHYEVFTGFLS